ncbi:hypothetical protein SBOR_3767 [Sclerotinia borealis F-4128]|uniref:GH18 domain-containing protein n=1 Tax=Sclerotinia borealis (strain F-4128) TaxID=1432307 RepID=W9CMW3_SCLBF|nr:hypothetical protein SBOR_3767 [Sclerotinia borealis F-4128]
MHMVEDEELVEMCNVIAALLILATALAEDLIQWASEKLTLPSGPSETVLRALRAIYYAFAQFQRLADQPNFDIEARPKLFRDYCFAYLKGCFKYSILFQRLLSPEDQCDHLDFYTEALECGFESCFKFDTPTDYQYPNSNHSYETCKQTLSDCLYTLDQIPLNCHLRAQPGKPVRPQYYRNPGSYGPRVLRNEYHPSNKAYFLKKRKAELLRQEEEESMMSTYSPVEMMSDGPQNYNNMDISGMDEHLDFRNPMAYDYAGSWDSVTEHQTNVYASGENPGSMPYNTEDAAVRAYEERGRVDSNTTSSSLSLPSPGMPASGLSESWSGNTDTYLRTIS